MSKTQEERDFEDEEQIKYLKEYKNKKMEEKCYEK